MAKQEVGLKIDVDVQSVGNMKQQLRAATQELIAMNEKFGSSSKEATEAARRVASLKDAIGDAKALADTFNPDKKFVALGGAVQGAVAGFSALQGAMGLFGSESKEVEQLLLKVQSAMALQQGISGVAGAMDAFGLLAGKIKTQVIVAFNSLRAAIGATGIGLLVVGIGLLVANFDKVKEAVMRFIPGLKTLSDFVGGLVTKLTDFVGITSEAERNLEKFTKANKKANETIDAQIKLLEAQGGKEDQIYQKKKERIENELNLLRQTLKAKGKLTDEELKQFRDLKLEQQLLDIEEANRKKKVAEESGKKQTQIDNQQSKEKQDAEKQLTDFIKAENEKRLLAGMTENEKELFEFRKKFAEKLAIAKKYNLDTKELDKLRFKEGLDLVNKSTAEETKTVIDANAKKLGDFTAMVPKMATVQTTITANQKIETNVRKQIAEDEVNKRIESLNRIFDFVKQTTDSLTSIVSSDFNFRQSILAQEGAMLDMQLERKLISDKEYQAAKEELVQREMDLQAKRIRFEQSMLIIKQIIAAKELILEVKKNIFFGKSALARGITATSEGAAQTAKVGFPQNIPLLIGYGIQAAGIIMSIRQAIKTMGAAGDLGALNASGIGGGGITTTAPVTPALAPQVVATQVNTAAVNQMGNRAARAYVLNSDIQNDNQRNAYIDRNASLG